MSSGADGGKRPIVIGYGAGEGGRLANEAGLVAEGRSETIEASNWSALNRVAEQEDASAIVVGSRGLSGFKQMLLGSTSSGLLHHPTRPVVVARGSHDV